MRRYSGWHRSGTDRLRAVEQLDQLIVQVGLPFRHHIDNDKTDARLKITDTLGREDPASSGTVLVLPGLTSSGADEITCRSAGPPKN